MSPSCCRFGLIGSSLTLAVLLTGGPAVTAADTLECSVASLQGKAPEGTTITTVTIVEAAGQVPKYCRVDGSVATPGNTVPFRLGLPATWNGKFFFVGVGGFAGSIGSLNQGLQRGYASASTDTGHQGGVTDASWAVGNPAKKIDYGHRGTHVTAVAAKSLSQAFYGTALRYAYFSGCSNGGRQALMEAQRYPEDFDGIVAGDPSFGTLGQIRRTLTYQALLASAESFLPASKLPSIAKAAAASCDARDGLIDGLVSDPRACAFKPDTLKCAGADGPTCLTAGQIETLKKNYGDVRVPGGKTIQGFPVGHEDGATGWQLWITGANDPLPQANGTLDYAAPNRPTGYRFQDGYLRYLAFEKDNADYDWRTFSFERDGARLDALASLFSPTDPDLTKLQKRGGKLLLYHGWADPAISAYGTIAYYDEVVKKMGGKQKADDSVRLFLVPGMHHCNGGPGPNTFDSLTALEEWVEKGLPPTRIVASHATNGKVDRTRPLCPHPQVAQHIGSGSVDDAANFRCALPKYEIARRP